MVQSVIAVYFRPFQFISVQMMSVFGTWRRPVYKSGVDSIIFSNISIILGIVALEGVWFRRLQVILADRLGDGSSMLDYTIFTISTIG